MGDIPPVDKAIVNSLGSTTTNVTFDNCSEEFIISNTAQPTMTFTADALPAFGTTQKSED